MATEIDKRVVEMQFDNKDFEKNCQATLTTLEKLKMALNFDGAKGLDSISKAANKVDLSNLSNSADAVSVKFSAMQIAGMTAIQEITKGLLNFGRNVWNNTFGQIRSGGMARTLKIEQANFQMEALAKNMDAVKKGLVDATEVVKAMGKAASDAVDGTAYGLDAASAVASQLMASGLLDPTKMKDYLRAIAGAASMTGRSFEDIGNIFTTVASNGRLMTMQLRQFSAAGLNLSATLAQSAKFAGKTEEQINEMVTKGQISFEDFAKALGDAFGDAAGKADDTFSGVTSNIKAQLSRIGQLFTDPFVENVIPFLKQVKARIKDVRTVLVPLGKTWEEFFKYVSKLGTVFMKNLNVARLRSFVNGIENILVALIEVIWTIGRAIREVFPMDVNEQIYKGIRGFEALTRKLIPTKEALNEFKTIVKALLIPLKAMWTIGVAVVKYAIYPMLNIFVSFVTVLVKVGAAFKPVIEAILQFVSSGEFLGNIIAIITATLVTLAEVLITILECVAKLITELTQSGTFQMILTILKEVGILLANVITNALLFIFNIVNDILSLVTSERIEKFFDFVIGGLAYILTTILGVWEAFKSWMSDIGNSDSIIGDIVKLFQELWAIITGIFQGNDISGNLDKLGLIMESLKTHIKTAWEEIKNFLHELDAGKVIVYAFCISMVLLILSVRNLIDSLAGIANTIKEGIGKLVDIFDEIKDGLHGLIKMSPALQFLLGMSIAIATLAVSLKVLSEVPWKDLKHAAIILGSFAAGLVLFAIVLSKLNWLTVGEGAIVITPFLLAISGAILMISIALTVMAKAEISLKQIVGPLIAVGTLLALLTGAIVAINKSMQLMFPEEKKLALSAGAILAVAVSITLLTKCVLALVDIPLKQAATGLIVVAGLLLSLAAAMAIVGAAGFTFTGGMGAIAFIISFTILMKSIQKISELPFDQMVVGLKNAGMVMAALAALYLAMIGISLLAGGNVFMHNMSSLLFSFTALIGIMSLAIIALGSLDQNQIAKGITTVSLLALVFAGITKLIAGSFDKLSANMKTYRDTSILKSLSRFLVAFAGCIALLVVTCHLAKNVTVGEVATISVLMVLLAACVAGVELASAHTKRANMGVIIAFMAGVIGILTAMTMLTLVDKDGLSYAIAAVAVVMLGLALIGARFAMTSKEIDKEAGTEAKAKKNTGLFIAFILGIMGIMGSIAALVKVAGDVKTDTLGVITITIGMVMVLVAALVGVIAYVSNKVNDVENVKALSTFVLAIAAALAVVAGVVMGIAYINGGDFAKALIAITSFGVIVLAFCGIMHYFNELIKNVKDTDNKKILVTVASVLLVTTSIGLIAAALTGMVILLKDIPVERSVVAFAEVILSFVVMMKLFDSLQSTASHFNDTDISKTAFSVVLMSVAFGIIAGAITAMTKILGNLRVERSVVSFAEILISFIAIMVAFNKFLEATSEMKTTDILKASASIVIMTAAFTVIAGAITAMTVINSGVHWGRSILSTVEILASFGAVLTGFYIFMKKIKDYSTNDILKTAGIVVLATSALIIISLSLSKLTSAITGDPDGVVSAIAAFMMILGSFAIVSVVIYQVSKRIKEVGKLLVIAASIVIACSALLIIAGAIMMLKDVKVDEGFTKKMLALMVPFASLVALFTLVSIFGKQLEPTAMLAISASVIMGSVALLIIAESITKVVEATKYVKPENLDTVINIFNNFMVLLAILVGIGGILGGLNVIGTGVIVGIAVIIGAFVLFAEGAKILAAAVDQVVDTALKLNNVDVDGDKIKNNILNSVSGIADGIIASIPKITEAALYLIGAVLAVVLLVKNKAVLIGIAYVLAFLAGMEAALPAILSMVSSIMKAIVDWLEEDGNMELIGGFFEKVGEMLVSIIGGALKGLIGEMADQFDAFLEKYNLSAPGLGLAEAAQKKAAETMTKDREHNAQLDRLNNVLDYYHMYDDVANMSDEMWMKVVDDFNRVADAARQSGKELDDQAKDIVMTYMEIAPEEAVAKLDAAYTGATETVEEFTDTVEVANDTLQAGAETSATQMGHLEQSAEAAADSMNELGATSEDAANKTEEAFSEASDGAKEFSVDWESIKKKVDSYGDGFKNSLKNIDIKGLSKKLGVESASLGSVLGKITGTSFGEDYEETLDYYMEDAMKKIYDKTGQWQYKWQTFKNEKGERIYRSAEEYANAMMDKAGSNTSYALTKLADFLGINLDVNDALKDGAGLLGDYGKAASGASEKLEEFRKGLKDSIASAMHGIFDEVKEQEYISPEEMLNRMSENIRQVGEWARNIATLAARGMSEGLLNELKDMGPAGAAKVKAFVEMTDEQLQMANRRWSAAEFLPDYGTKEIENAYRDAGFNASLGFSNGIDPNAANTAAKTLGDNSVNALEEILEEHSPSKRTERDGIYLTKGLANGMTNAQAQGIIRDASTRLGVMLFKNLSTSIDPNKMKNVANNTLAGFENGLSAKMPSILSKVTTFCAQIINQFQRVLRMHSPSQVMEGLGENTMKGYENGLETEAENAEKISGQSVNNILNSMTEQIAAITNSVGEEGVYEPVIRPVFDMTAIEQGYSDIQSWFANSQGLNLNGSISRLTPTRSDESSMSNQMLIDAIRNINNDDVVDELSELRNDISNLQTAITHMQVVMNTGALVGQIMEPMDKALGNKALMNSRGRY